MKLGIIGYGVVGSVTGELFSRAHEVHPYDKYREGYNSHENFEVLARNSEVTFICVPTPMKPSGEIDYSAIHDSMGRLQSEVERLERDPDDMLVVIRSTAVSGTTDKLAAKYPFRIAFNPEFLTEKNAKQGMENPERIVLGVEDERSEAQLRRVYEPLYTNVPVHVMSRREAEATKYVANILLASEVMVANELFHALKSMGVDYQRILPAVRGDKRIGTHIEVPGHDGDFGIGGKCFPKDIRAFTYLCREHGYEPRVLQAMWDLNLRVRKNQDWLKIPGATSGNTDFEERQD